MIMDILLYTTICIECNMYIIYTYSYLFVNMYISFNQETLLYFDLVYFHFVSVFDHSLSSSSVVIHRLLDAKVVLPGNTANTSPLLTINFSRPSEIK